VDETKRYEDEKKTSRSSQEKRANEARSAQEAELAKLESEKVKVVSTRDERRVAIRRDMTAAQTASHQRKADAEGDTDFLKRAATFQKMQAGKTGISDTDVLANIYTVFGYALLVLLVVMELMPVIGKLCFTPQTTYAAKRREPVLGNSTMFDFNPGERPHLTVAG
jgi:Flp pilus assembly protein TadB